MINIGIKQKNIYIGIDIGTSTIKAVEIEAGLAGELTLRKANMVLRSEGIKKALSGMSSKGAKVIGIINCPTICLRYLTVPMMPGKELSEAIKWEAKDKIPFPLEEASMDYNIQEEIEEAGVKKLRIKFAALPTQVINDMMALLREAGIEPISLMEPPLAVECLARHLNLNKEEAVAIIDIGSEFTEINIVKHDSLKFYRKINSAGAAITKAMTSALVSEQGRVELSAEDAEKIKIKYGIPKEATADLIEGKISASQLISLIRPAIERLLQEIERSFEYYREESEGDKVKSVVLFGGSAQLKGLAGFLQESLGVSVSVGDPLKGISVRKGAIDSPESVTHRLANAVGAALSEGKGINLLPIELKQKTVRTFEHAAIESVAAAVIVGLVLTLIGMRIQLAGYEKKINAGNLELKAMLPQLEVVLNYERLKSEASQRRELTESLLSETPPWNEVFRELSNKIPKEAVLTEIKMENNELLLKGEIAGTPKNREELLSILIAALEGGVFRQISLVNAKMGEGENARSEFEIKCTF
ncbi:MAG: type IV pilus assembly protein PilM [Candidatus Omnitrophota bacterium]|nr:type IV pilus assembly protein PilM [Candidatus Omnitrophota bacterium]